MRPDRDTTVEMLTFVFSGRCPKCGTQILSRLYQRFNHARIMTAWQELSNPEMWPIDPDSSVKAASSAVIRGKAQEVLKTQVFWNPNETVMQMRCETCGGTWDVGYVLGLGNCKLTSVEAELQFEKLLSEERHSYRNPTEATLTKEISIANTYTSSVTTDRTRVTSSSIGGSLTAGKFASIQARIERQLGERYSVQVQTTLSVGEKTSITIPPNSSITHVIQWKLVAMTGIAVLGTTQGKLMGKLPYEVPLRLTYTDRIEKG
jgi:hypothetical protein